MDTNKKSSEYLLHVELCIAPVLFLLSKSVEKAIPQVGNLDE